MPTSIEQITQNLSNTDFPYVLIPGKVITLNHKGSTRIISAEDPRFQKIMSCIKEGRWNDLPALMDPSTQLKVYSNGRMKLENGQVTINGKKVSSRLNARIISLMEDEQPFDVLVNFQERLEQCPSNRVLNQLFDFLEANHFPLHPDGRFLAYKGVRSDYKDIHSGTFDNSPGQRPSVPRNQVDENPEQTCSYGLHVASHAYAHSFSNNQKVIEVLVDPKDVVAVPTDHNNAKMRVCEYLVIGDSKGERSEQVYQATKQCEVEDEKEEDYDIDPCQCDGCEGCDYAGTYPSHDEAEIECEDCNKCNECCSC